MAKEYTFTSQSIAGEIIDAHGKNAWKPSSPKWWRYALSKFKVGEEVSVVLTSKKPKRTENQSRYYFSYLQIIGDETGEDDKDALHALFKGLFLTQSVKEVMGEKVRITKSTTDLSVGDFVDYIKKIERHTGILAPDPKAFYLKSLGPVGEIEYPDEDITPSF